MKSKPSILVQGGWAVLKGAIPTDVLSKVLAIPDPKREHSAAYLDGRWDGMIRLYEGNRFPAGCVSMVADACVETGYEYPQIEGLDPVEFDTSRFDARYFPARGKFKELWPHQVDAVRAFFANPRSCAQLGTGAGKSMIIAAGSRYYWEELGLKSLVLTSKKGLARQLARDLAGIYGSDVTVGQMGDGVKRLGDVTVGTAATLMGFMGRMRDGERGDPDPLCVQAIEEAGVLWIDEAHHAGSAATWFAIALASGATIRHGLSGTLPDPRSLNGIRLLAATGPVVYRKPGSELAEENLLRKPKICMVMNRWASHPQLPMVQGERRYNSQTLRIEPTLRFIDGYKAAYDKAVVYSLPHNRSVARAAAWCVRKGRKPLVVCRRRPQWELLGKLIQAEGVAFRAIYGPSSTTIRDQTREQMTRGEIDLVLATNILDEGEDWPVIDAVVMAEGVKTDVPGLQRIGRGMRMTKGGPKDVWIVDFVPLSHSTLTKHALERCESYEGANYETVVVEDWPRENEPTPDDLLPFEQWAEVTSCH